MLLFGSVILNVFCISSVVMLAWKAREQHDIICSMQIYIAEKTGKIMTRKQIKQYGEYWRNAKKEKTG